MESKDCLALQMQPYKCQWLHELAGFVGALAAAMDVQIVGNKESIRKVPLYQYITRIIKYEEYCQSDVIYRGVGHPLEAFLVLLSPMHQRR